MANIGNRGMAKLWYNGKLKSIKNIEVKIYLLTWKGVQNTGTH